MTTQEKTLRRLPRQGQIAGVCAGLAKYFNLDITLMRVIFVIMAFATSGGVIVLYFILAIIIPSAEGAVPKASDSKSSEDDDTIGEKVQNLSQEIQENGRIDRLRNYLGIGLLAFGAWLLLGQFFPQWLDIRWDYVWPALLIVAGFLIIARKK